jgi:hypothetical protein
MCSRTRRAYCRDAGVSTVRFYGTFWQQEAYAKVAVCMYNCINILGIGIGGVLLGTFALIFAALRVAIALWHGLTM